MEIFYKSDYDIPTMLKYKTTIYISIFLSGFILIILSFKNQKIPFIPKNKPLVQGAAATNSQIQYRDTEIENLSMSVPVDWVREKPSSAMRLAQFVIPNKSGENSNLTIFNKIGGTVEQNLNRWAGQFQQTDGSDSKERAEFLYNEINGISVTFMYVTGTFLSGGMMGGEVIGSPGFALHAAIIEFPNENYYFKMTGPSSEMIMRKSEFVNFVEKIEYNK